MLSILLSFIHFRLKLLKISEIFQKMMKRFLRGSSSRSSKDKQSEEEERPKYNLPRTAEVRPCEWPSNDFLRAVGMYDDFYELAENAGLTDFLRDQREQYLLIILCKIFISILGDHHLRWNFIYIMSIRRCHFMIFVGFVGYPLRAA